jgi:hypothetical protein
MNLNPLKVGLNLPRELLESGQEFDTSCLDEQNLMKKLNELNKKQKKRGKRMKIDKEKVYINST